MASIPSTIGLAVLLFIVLSIYAIVGVLLIGPKQMYEHYYNADGEQLYNADENFSTYLNAMVVMYVRGERSAASEASLPTQLHPLLHQLLLLLFATR